MATSVTSWRGDSLVLDIDITDPDTGDPVNIDGVSLFFTLKNRYSDTDASAVLQTTNAAGGGITVTSKPNGEARLVVSPTLTATLLGTYVYDVQAIDVSNRVWTVANGWVLFKPDVSRTTTAITPA